MKNKIFFKIIITMFLLLGSFALAENEFKFEGDVINILEDGNKIVSKGNVKFVTNNNDIITSDNSTYNKKESTLIANGNVKFIANDSVIITSDNATYNKVTLILNATGNVKINDKINKTIIFAEYINYYKSEEVILSKGVTSARIDNEYFLKSKDIRYEKKKGQLSSDNLTSLDDDNGNLLTANNFKYFLLKKQLRAKNIEYFDVNKDKYLIEDAYVNLITKEVFGKDIETNFNNSAFGNEKNEPRMKGKKIYANDKATIISKGIFTTCKKRDGCPPWVITSSEAKHDKIKKIIVYKNAWLKVYDVPVLYFPKFFHPDPTVKRQSGFLGPEFNDSTLFGASLFVPYFHVISDSKDMTFKPKFYEGKKITLQNEYREVTENSNHIVDFSFTKSDLNENNSKTKSHFFSKTLINLGIGAFDISELRFNIQKTSDETYLQTYKVKSDLIDYNPILKNSVNFNAFNDDTSINTEIAVYEDTTIGRRNDKYEYVYPSFSIVKDLNFPLLPGSSLSLSTSGSQRKSKTNNYNSELINELTIKNIDYLKSGLVNEYDYTLKNSNEETKNPETDTDITKSRMMTGIMLKSSLPLEKKSNEYNQYFTPIASLRFSPNHTNNMHTNSRIINTDNIYAFDRVGQGSAIEGGEALTLGTEYILNDNTRDLIKFNLATNFRTEENKDLPETSTLGQKTSDIFGYMKLDPNKNIDIDYKFSLDNNFDTMNYNLFNTTLSINNFVTSFSYLEENYDNAKASYLENNTSYTLDENNKIRFGARKNKLTNLTEFYNLVYEYKNDCLIASIVYNKEYYTNEDLRPNESLLFNITIIPFETFSSQNLKN